MDEEIINTKETEQYRIVYSDQINTANYYEWISGQSDEYGLFVSLVPHTSKIDICNGTDIFGVTVPIAGFVGGQNWDIPRGKNYALVVTSGLVEVKCEFDVEEGDYVISNGLGVAEKTNSSCGYKVISVDVHHDVKYAAIVLGVQACTTDKLGRDIQSLDTRLDSAEANIVGVINTVHEACKKVDECTDVQKETSDKVDSALSKVDDTVARVDEFTSYVEDVAVISTQAKTIAESAATAAEGMRNVAIEKAEKALEETFKFGEELGKTASQMSEKLDGAILELRGLEEDLKPLAMWPEGADSGSTSSYAGFVAKAHEDSALLASMVRWKDGTGTDSLAGFVSEATAENAEIKALAEYGYVDEYGKQHYGASGIMAEVDKNKAAIEAIANQDGNTAGLQAQVDANKSAIDLIARRVDSTYVPVDTWNEADKDQNIVYYAKDTKHYWYYNDGVWKETVDATEAGLSSAIADIQIQVDENSSSINNFIDWQNDASVAMARIEQKADANGAYIQSTVSNMDKYSVGPHTQAYGFTLEQAANVLEDGMIYVPTEASTETYDYTDANNTIQKYTRNFTRGYLYKWGKLKNYPYGWTTIDKNYVETDETNTSAMAVYFTDKEPSVSDNFGYWYTDGDTITGTTGTYHPHTLYKWESYKQTDINGDVVKDKDGNAVLKYHWVAVATLAGNSSNRAVSQIRQDANSLVTEVTSVRGDAAALELRVKDTEVEVQSLATWTKDENGNQYNLATIKQTADDAGASVTQIVESVGENGKVNAASIVTAVNKANSSVVINADHIKFEGFVSFASKDDVKEVQDNAVYDTKIEYALSSSSTNFTPVAGADGQWSTTAPGWKVDTYMWQKNTVIKGDTSVVSTQTCIQGAKGADGTGIAIKGMAYVKDVNVNESIINNEYIIYSDAQCTTQIVSAKDGDSYLIDGYLFVYSGTGDKFTCIGKIQGPAGADGYTPIKGVDYFDGTSGNDGVSIIWKGTYASAPINPQNGWAYYNSTAKASYVYQDGSWYQMSVDGVDGQNGSDGLSVVWKGDLSASPTSPQENWVYRDTDDGKVYIYNGTGWELMVLDGSDGQDGTDGTDGLSVFITYNDSATTPKTPTGNGTSDGWHTNATSESVWMSQKVAENATSGTWGAPIKIQGDNGVGVSNVINYYMASARSTGVLSGNVGELVDEQWTTDVQTTSEGKPYLWNYEATVYTNGQSTLTDAAIIGNYSKDGTDGKGIKSIEEFYCISANTTCATPSASILNASTNFGGTATADKWYKTTPPTDLTHKYLWNCERITYTDDTYDIFAPALIGTHGAKGSDGTGVSIKGTAYIKDITIGDNIIGNEYPLYSDKNCITIISGATDGDSYLVDGYLFVYSGSDNLFTCAGKIQGPAGDTGVGVSAVVNYYMASARSTGVIAGNGGETADEQWTTNIQTTSSDKPYLWNYEETVYTNGNSVPTNATIIGNYSKDGKGIQSIEEFYCINASTSCATPTASTLDSAVNYSSSAVSGRWYKTSPPTSSTLKYLWNCERITYTKGDPVIFAPALIGTHGTRGSSGYSLQVKYINSATVPTIINNDVSQWSDVVPTVEKGKRTYMTQKMSNATNWSTPVQMSAEDGITPTVGINESGYWVINGEESSIKAQGTDGDTPVITVGANGNWYVDGKDTGTKAQGPQGTDGDMIEYVYYRSIMEQANLSKPSYDESGNLPSGWTASPQGITETYKYEYMSLRTRTNEVWSTFSDPVVWSRWGDKGQDGDGISYEYYLKNSEEPPTYNASDPQWTDEPTGVSESNRYEYVVQIKTTTQNGKIISTPSGVALWAKWSQDGDDGVTPTIGVNGNWWLDNVDTGYKAVGDNGVSPVIGENGNWWIGELDTGVAAHGKDAPTITNTTKQYCVLAANKQPDENTIWSDEPQNYQDGSYIWVREIYTMSDGLSIEGAPYLDTFTSVSQWCKDNNITFIDGASIYTGSITTDQIAANALHSENYTHTDADGNISAPTLDNGGRPPYSNSGTFFDLKDGAIYSKNFAIEPDGTSHYKGALNANQITSGYITAEQISANAIRSSNYPTENGEPIVTEGQVFSESGTFLNLENGTFYSPQFAIDEEGHAHFKGNLSAEQITTGKFTAAQLDVAELSVLSTNLGQVNAGSIQSLDYGQILIWEQGSQGLTFTSNGDGTCYVSSKGTCTDANIVIPKVSSQGWLVTSIGNNAFSSYKAIESVTIPDSVTSIGSFAFNSCYDLTSVVFSGKSNLQTINMNAFAGCSKLTSFVIPDSVTEIANNVFRNCTNLANVTISGGITTIPQSMFSTCSNLMHITIPTGITKISSYAFENCSKLASMVIPDTLTSVDNNAFTGCNPFTKYYMGDSTDWNKIAIGGTNNTAFQNGSTYYYSYERPATRGSYWHYDGFRISCDDKYLIDTQNFKVTNDGNVEASNGTFEGNITATSGIFKGSINAEMGNIGKLRIQDNSINTETGSIAIVPETGTMSVNQCEVKNTLKANWITGFDQDSAGIQLIAASDYTDILTFAIDTDITEEGAVTKSPLTNGTKIQDAGNVRITLTSNMYTTKSFAVPVSVRYYSRRYLTNYMTTFFVYFQKNQQQQFVDVPYWIYNNQQDGCEYKGATCSHTETQNSGSVERIIKCYGHVVPNDESYNLGTQDVGWGEVYAWNMTASNRIEAYEINATSQYLQDGSIFTSDADKKNTITPIEDQYSAMYDMLRPVSFKLNDGTSGRTHTGLIAQELKESMDACGIDSQDFAAYCSWKDADGNETCGIRYTELIALNIREIQSLKTRVKELEEKLAEYENDTK